MLGLIAILGVWLIYGLWKMLFDIPQPGRKVTDTEVKMLLQMLDVKSRQKWLRNGGYKKL